MPTTIDPPDVFDRLRAQAQALIETRPAREVPLPTDMLELINELRIHQAELEIQNEELRRAQQELGDLQKEYEDLYEFAPCGYVTLNARGVITHINLAGAALLGKPRARLGNMTLAMFVAPNWENGYRHLLKNAALTNAKQRVEVQLARNDKGVQWVRLEITADRNPDDTVARWRIILTDINAEKEEEAALLDSEARFRELFDFAPVAYQALDEHGRLIAVNQKWLELMGYPAPQAIGKSFGDLLTPADRIAFESLLAGHAHKGGTFNLELRLTKRDHTELLVDLHGSIGRNARGAFEHTHCLLVDITAQRRMEIEKKRLEAQLAQARKMESLGTLAGGIAHEINNILAIIMGNADLALDELPEGSALHDYLAEIDRASLRARDVVRQLLAFSRKEDVQKVALDTRSVIQEAMRLIRASTPAQIAIRCDIAAGVESIFGNPTQVSQILINLCSNARDAMLPGGGAIAVDVANEVVKRRRGPDRQAPDPGRYVRVRIGDTGSGMAPDVLRRIFEPYFTTKDVGQGTGIGLAIVHGIVRSHGGWIGADSNPGQGSVFTLLLPACRRQRPAVCTADEALPTGSERILLVDDEPSLLKMLRQQLERHGYTVQATTRPAEALKIFSDAPGAFDLVVTDMAMPELPGDQLAARILSVRKDVPILLCTGFSEGFPEAQAYAIGIAGFAMKPVDRTELLKKVRSLLDQARGKSG